MPYKFPKIVLGGQQSSDGRQETQLFCSIVVWPYTLLEKNYLSLYAQKFIVNLESVLNLINL